MTESRYSNRFVKTTTKRGMYRNVLKDRGLSRIKQFVSPKFITVPDEIRNNIKYDIVLWQIGDKYYKLADKYYGDPSLWWVIASFNLAPTEAHLEVGDTVYIPINWDVVYDYVRR